MTSPLSLILLGLLALLLLGACWHDLKSRTIPNGLNLAIVALAIPFWWASGLDPWPEVAIRIGVAVLVFGLFALAFALGAMGGGDVKLIAALALWLPWPAVVGLLILMSLAGGALTLFMVLRQRLQRRTGPLEIPYGVAIGFAGMWLISERFLYQFA